MHSEGCVVSSMHEPGSPDLRSGRDSDSSIDTLLASALQRNMSFTEDRKRQHTPGTANRPRQLRKGMDMEFDADQKENNDPVAPSTKKVTPSRLACIKQLEQEMTCSVCLDICVRPCTTPCGHDFCRKCLKQALRHQRRCPKCRASISLSAPICINTVLWNTIKLLFPKHAASAPDSPADAIFTPASTNRAAVVANAVADLPMRRGLARVPFIPPRISRPELPQPAASQRAPPSWLEGATRDSDPPASARRHRLASSSQQQTLSQAIDRWNGPAAGPGANAANGMGVFAQQPASPVGMPAHANTRRGRWVGRGGSNHLQRAHSAHGLRGPMPSMLDNLQRRLDDLPIPDILHRSNSSQSQEPAAGLEASPSLRVRPFPNPPQARQPQPPAPASSRLQATQPTQAQVWPQGAAWQPPRRTRPTWNAHAEPPAVRQGVLASEDWLLDLPDTPEAPRASAAAQRQAVADVLFETAAGESAVGDTETVLEDPSWLDDAAAYDAAVAEMDDDGISALDILSDDDSSPVNAMRSQARLNLSSLEHLLLSDSEQEDAEGGADNSSAAGIPSASDRQSMEAQGSAAQTNSVTNVLVLNSAGEDTNAAASATATAVNTSQPASQITSEGAQSADQAGPDSPPEMALGHDGRPRVVMSDVTSRFPTEQQQLLQQLPEEGADKAKDSSFQVQRRGRQPRVCRSLLPSDTDTAAVAANCSNSQGASTSAGALDAPILRPMLRSSARSQAMQSTSQVPEASSAESQTQTTRCTRRQARLNKQSSQSSSQHGPPLSHADLSSDDDFVVVSRSQRSNRSAAAASQAPPLHSGLAELHVSNQPASNVPLAGVAQHAAGIRKNRPRLQLNRNASKKSAQGWANGSEAAAGPSANMNNVS